MQYFLEARRESRLIECRMLTPSPSQNAVRPGD